MKKIFFFLLLVVSVQSVSSQEEIEDIGKIFPCNGCTNPSANFESLRPVGLARLQEVFKEISKNSGIEFNYSQAACQQRTQFLSMLLTKKYKLDHVRVWLFSPNNLSRDGKASLVIQDKNDLAENGKIFWAYHVAPAVKIEGKVYVIDPSIDSENPMLLERWFKSIGNSDKSKYSFLSSEYYFFNRENDCYKEIACPLSGYFYKYEGNAKDNLLVEKGLALNDAAIKIYSKYLLPLKNSTKESDKEKFNELKKVFGNYDNLENFLLQNPDRNFYAKYGEIAVEAKKIYLERILFWFGKTEELLRN